MDRWIGKVAVITGASSGIGASTAIDLADKGIIVVGLARQFDKLQQVAKSTKGKIHIILCDIQVEMDILKAFSWIENNLGGVDLLINNAGLALVPPLMRGKTEEWKAIWETNVLGLSICTREALKTMRKRGDNGQIIHINSICGHIVPGISIVNPGMYTASKHAVTSLTESLRVELYHQNSNIKVTSISPGSTATELLYKVFSKENTQQDNFNLDPSLLMQPQDVTDAIIYVLSTRPRVQVHELILQPIGENIQILVKQV